jgi:hypothetical protein
MAQVVHQEHQGQAVLREHQVRQVLVEQVVHQEHQVQVV